MLALVRRYAVLRIAALSLLAGAFILIALPSFLIKQLRGPDDDAHPARRHARGR